MRAPFVVATCLSLLSCSHAPPPVRSATPTGIAVFTRHPKFVDAKISPGGTWLAAVSVEGGKRSLAILALGTRKLASVFRPDPQSVGNYHWANDSRLVVELLDQDGTLAAPVSTGEIYAVDADGRGGKMIFGYRAGKDRSWWAGQFLSAIPRDDRQVLINAIDFRGSSDRTSTVYKLDVYTGHTTTVAASPAPGASFVIDENGEVRIAAAMGEDVEPRYFYRDAEHGWSELSRLRGFQPNTSPIGFDAKSRTIYAVDGAPKGIGLYAVSIDSGERKLLSSNEFAEPDGYLRDRQTGQVVAVEFPPDVPTWDILVPEHPLARVLKGMLDAYPDANARVLSATADLGKAVVSVYSDRDPGRLLLVDVASMSAEELVSARPWIEPKAMAPMSAFHIAASDGMWIHGYLTLPAAAGASGPPPLVVIPHGGPHFVRDNWRFDPEVQLLASQGFAVLQVNYRGSGGYSRKYQQAGYRHWGDRVMQDIIDATRYVVGKGQADAKRVCIYGASFGGYAAMQAAILAPDLYRCAVGYAGVYDLTLMEKEGDISESKLGRGFVRTVLGDDVEVLQRMSPVHNVDKLRAQVLLIHGKRDVRAPIEHAERLKRALEERGAPPEWLVEPKEGHGFYDEDARERMYARLIEFLKKNTAP